MAAGGVGGLVGWLVVMNDGHTGKHRGRWRGRPGRGGEGPEAELARLGDRAQVARALLAALAWARGPGLPANDLWLRVATALAGSGEAGQPPVTEADQRWLLHKGRGLVTEDVGPGGRVYRLRDAAVAAHLRGGAPVSEGHLCEESAVPTTLSSQRPAIEQTITVALTASVPDGECGRDWAAAHPYVRAYLAEHAAAAGAGVLADLVAEPGFLAAADPLTLGPLMCVPAPELTEAGRVYRRAYLQLGADPAANSAYLQEAASALAVAGAAGMSTGVRPRYRTHLTAVRRDDSLYTVAAGFGGVSEVAFGAVKGDGEAGGDRRLLAAACDDHRVRLWDPLTGMPVGEPLAGHTDEVWTVAFGTVKGESEEGRGGGDRLLLASGGRDETVRLWDPLTGEPVGAPLTGHTGSVSSVIFGTTAEGRLLLASTARDGPVWLWDPLTGEQAGEPLTGHTGQVFTLASGNAPDGRLLLASASYDGTVRVWDPVAGTPFGDPLVSGPGSMYVVALGSTDGGRLLLALSSRTEGNTVRVWDPVAGVPVGEPLTGQTDWVFGLAFAHAPDGRLLLASAGRDQQILIRDPLTGAQVGGPLVGHAGHVNLVAFGTVPDGRLLLASCGYDQTVRLWDPLASTPASAQPLSRTTSVTAAAFGSVPGGPLLVATAGGDQAVRVRDALTGVSICGPLAGRAGWAGAVAFGAPGDGRLLLACGSTGHTVRIVDAFTGSPAGEPLAGHTGPVTSVAFAMSPGGRLLLASASDDHTVRIWDPVSGTLIGEPLARHTGWVCSVAFGVGQDGMLRLASAGEDQVVGVWEPFTGALLAEFPTGGSGAVRTVAFSPAGELRLAAAGEDGVIRIWDPLTAGLACEPLTGHAGWVSSMTFATMKGERETGKGRPVLVSGGGDRTVRIWDPVAGSCLATLLRRSTVLSLAAAGPVLAVGDEEGLSVIELDALPPAP